MKSNEVNRNSLENQWKIVYPERLYLDINFQASQLILWILNRI